MAIEEVEKTASATHDDYSNNDTDSVFGGDDDLWGAAEITAEQLADPTFCIKFDADVGAGLLRVDDITVEVFFELPQADSSLASMPPYAAKGLQAGSIGKDDTGALQFVVVGAGGQVKSSHDGENWTERNSGVASTLRGIAAGKSGFMAVGDNGTVITSGDGETWTEEEAETVDSLTTVTFNPDTEGFTACGQSGVVRQKKDAAWHRIRN